MTPTQYLLCGLPFSGKTTLGKFLADKLGFVHINLDEIKKEKGYGKVSDDDVPDKVWEEIFEIADGKLLDALIRGKNVVNETAWVTREWRDRARKIAAGAGFPTKVIFLDIPEEICRHRRLENQETHARYETFDKEFEDYLYDFEKPTEDEDLIIYDGKIPLKEWTNQNFDSLR